MQRKRFGTRINASSKEKKEEEGRITLEDRPRMMLIINSNVVVIKVLATKY